MSDDRMVEIEEIAEALGVSRQTVYGWKLTGRHNERLPLRRNGRGRLYCMASDLERFREFYVFGDETED